MKSLLLLYLFCFSVFISYAQETGSYTDMSSVAPDIPFSETFSSAAIATYINTNYKTEKEKLYAIYSWITTNIKYATDSMYIINTEKNPEAKITVALRRRKGVCENFAAIFNDVALKCGIKSYEVSGYTKQYGSIDKTGHTWCVVYIDSRWHFCDPTWDAGFTGSAKYFLIEPAFFIESHMPFDPLWQLLDHAVSHKEFYEGNTHSKKDKPFINFSDSVHSYLNMSELEQLEATELRMKREGIPNELVKLRDAYVHMKISIIQQDKSMNIYNATVFDFNTANNILNDFITYRNNQFIPAKPDKELPEMLLPIDDLIFAAYKKLVELDNIPDNFQYDPGLLRNRLDALSARAKEQKDFLKKYLSLDKAEREKLFYK